MESLNSRVVEVLRNKDHFSNHNYSVNGEVGFPPLRLIKAGDYTVWVQVKTENKIITQKFNFAISS